MRLLLDTEKDLMKIVILQSALKHGLTGDDIAYALRHVQKSRTIEKEGNINKEVEYVLAILPNGNLCELGTTYSHNEQSIVVFHALTPPTKGFLKKIEGRQ